MSETLRKYLALREVLVTLLAVGEEDAADVLRDRMDPLWYALTNAERMQFRFVPRDEDGGGA